MGLLPNGNSRMVTPFSESSAKAFEMEDWKDFKTFDNTNDKSYSKLTPHHAQH